MPRVALGALSPLLLPQCSAPCGGGIQRRQVKCMDTRTGVAEEDGSLCDHEPRPESTQKCNPQDCESSEPGEQQEKPAWKMMWGVCGEVE